MKYRYEKTGFVFESVSEVHAPGWVCLDPVQTAPQEEKKPVKKRTRKEDK